MNLFRPISQKTVEERKGLYSESKDRRPYDRLAEMRRCIELWKPMLDQIDEYRKEQKRREQAI